ncbi:Thioredoxin reductase [Pirellulimonas nuda]|uniref:Thioredoxin reductase n=1 Tax=Pirellulimonas nuda TaxID=2528009 RepID=A0A518DC32_9BACT|nr:FAD-dependent oxidoreductase [Pirellulimonas nuda]QDU89042.1 Thioredoxin reductase [Pirellulimonas nuda]
MLQRSSDQIAFPTLDDQQIAQVAELAELTHFKDGEELIAHAQKDYPFYVIRTGRVLIVERDDGQDRPIATHCARAFVGDVDMLTGRSSMFVALADGPVDAYRLCAIGLRRLLRDRPTIGEVLLEAFQMRRQMLADLPFVGVRVVGRAKQAQTTRLLEFLYKNHVPNTYFDADDAPGMGELVRLAAQTLPLPVVRCNGHTVGDPSLPRLAECIGINRNVDQQRFDLVIVGSGPAGLAAAVYASSEGVSTLVIDSVGPGGQAGSSSKIENFMGFPSGLSGSELAGRGYLQALKFGTQFIAPITVSAIEPQPSGEHHLTLCSGQTARARCVLVASGVSYRQLDLAGCREFEGAGVYYAATSVESRACEGDVAVVVGGGNSAGQAAMFLAAHAREVKVLIRGNDLRAKMSSYLAERVLQHPNIRVILNAEVAAVEGDVCVRSIQLRDRTNGATSRADCAGLFIFVGAKPHTEWLPRDVLLDENGFVVTGSAFFGQDASLRSRWPLERPPCDLETTVPGILAAGDVRSGALKRCGFAVGEGSLAVACVHRLLSLA